MSGTTCRPPIRPRPSQRPDTCHRFVGRQRRAAACGRTRTTCRQPGRWHCPSDPRSAWHAACRPRSDECRSSRAGRSAMRTTLLRHNQTPMWSTQLRRWWSGLQEDIPESLAPPDSYDDAEVAAMLRELGIALVEVVQPTQLVRNAAAQRGEALHHQARPRRRAADRAADPVGHRQLRSRRDDARHHPTRRRRPDRPHRPTGRRRGHHAGRRDRGRSGQARAMPPRFNPVVTVLGYVITTIGFSMIINPTWASLWGHAVPRPDRRRASWRRPARFRR